MKNMTPTTESTKTLLSQMQSIGRAFLPNDQRSKNSIIRAQQSKISLNVCHGLSSRNFHHWISSPKFVTECASWLRSGWMLQVDWLVCSLNSSQAKISFVHLHLFYLFWPLSDETIVPGSAALNIYVLSVPLNFIQNDYGKAGAGYAKGVENFKDVSHILN